MCIRNLRMRYCFYSLFSNYGYSYRIPNCIVSVLWMGSTANFTLNRGIGHFYVLVELEAYYISMLLPNVIRIMPKPISCIAWASARITDLWCVCAPFDSIIISIIFSWKLKNLAKRSMADFPLSPHFSLRNEICKNDLHMYEHVCKTLNQLKKMQIRMMSMLMGGIKRARHFFPLLKLHSTELRCIFEATL